MEPALEEHEILRDCADHISQAECEVRNALRSALDDAEPGWVLERLGRLSRELVELYSIVCLPHGEVTVDHDGGVSWKEAQRRADIIP